MSARMIFIKFFQLRARAAGCNLCGVIRKGAVQKSSRGATVRNEVGTVINFEPATGYFIPAQRKLAPVFVRKRVNFSSVARRALLLKRAINQIHNFNIASRKIKSVFP